MEIQFLKQKIGTKHTNTTTTTTKQGKKSSKEHLSRVTSRINGLYSTVGSLTGEQGKCVLFTLLFSMRNLSRLGTLLG